jgi:hypothetical protein
MGWITGVLFLVGGREVSLLHIVQASSGAYPVSNPIDTGALFPRLMWHKHKAGEVKNGAAIPTLPSLSSQCGANNQAQGELYLHLSTKFQNLLQFRYL